MFWHHVLSQNVHPENLKRLTFRDAMIVVLLLVAQLWTFSESAGFYISGLSVGHSIVPVSSTSQWRWGRFFSYSFFFFSCCSLYSPSDKGGSETSNPPPCFLITGLIVPATKTKKKICFHFSRIHFLAQWKGSLFIF